MALVAGLLVENQQKEVKFHGKSLGETLAHIRKDLSQIIYQEPHLITGIIYFVSIPRMLCNRNGAISHLQTEMGFVEDFRYSLHN